MMRTPRGFKFNYSNGVVECKLTQVCIRECSHPGRCDANVEFWVGELRKLLDKIPVEFFPAYLREFGAWDNEELQDHEENLKRFLWSVACDCREQKTCRTFADGSYYLRHKDGEV